MKARNALALAAVLIVAGAGVSGCETIGKINPLAKKNNNQVKASQGERIPLIAFDQKLEVSDALKGQDFQVPDAQPVESWPQAGGTPGQWIGNLQAGANFRVAWKRNFGSGSDRKIHLTAPPVAAAGRIYVMDAEAHVAALDASTGARVWRVDLAERSRRDKDAFGGGVAFDNGKLYVTSGYRFVAALDAASGKLLWRTRVDAPIHGAPTVMAGHVLAIDIEDELESYNAETGVSEWTYQALSEPARILAASSPAAAGETAIAAFASGELSAIQSANGNQAWTITLSRTSRTNALSEIRDIAGRPVIYNGDVLAGSHSGVFAAVDLRTGAPRWTLPITTITTPWPAGDAVFVVSQAGEVICASRDNGQVYWITELNKGVKRKKRALYFGPVLASGRLIVVSDHGEAVAMNPKTGAVESRLKLGDPVLMPPIAMNGTLYVATEKADLIAIR